MRPTVVFGSYRSIAFALADELCRRIRAGESAEIIVPTRSAAEALLSRLADVLPTTRLEVQSLETLATRIVNDSGRYPRIASEHERELAMDLAARGVDAELATTPGIAAMLLRSERDVRDSAIRLDDLRYRIGNAARLTVRERLGTVERIWVAARQILRDSGAEVMPDILTEAVAKLRDGATVPAQIVFGFYDATGAQAAFFDALAESGAIESIHIPVVPEADGGLREYQRFAEAFVGWARGRSADERRVTDSGESVPAWTITARPSPLREFHEVCRGIRTLLDEGVASADIAIVARSIDASEAALLAAMSRRFGFSLRGLPGRRLSGNRIVRGVVDLLLLQERGFLRRDVMEIVRSGARLPDIDGPLPSLDRLEAATRRALIARGRRALVLAAEKRARYQEDEPDETLLRYADLVDALESRTNGFGGNRSGIAWSHSLDEVVGLFRAESEEDLAAMDALWEIARSLRRGGFAPRRFDARTLTRLIDDAGPLPSPSPDEPAVWFGDVMRFRGRIVRHLFAVRMQHDSFPQRRFEDALLPDVDRRALGVRQIGDGRDEESFLFAILTSAATDAIHFSYASSDSIGRALRPSSFVKDFAIARHPEERLAILQDFRTWAESAPRPPGVARSAIESRGEASLEAPSPSVIRALQLQAKRGTGSPFDWRVSPDRSLKERLDHVFRRISPSRLEHLGECPQRFFVSSVLGLREVEDPEPDVQIEIRQKGLIDHQILEELYAGLTTDDWRLIEAGDPATLPRSLRERLAAVVATRFRAFDEEFPPLNSTVREIEREETEHLLARFAAGDLAELAGSGFRPAAFELTLDVNEEDESRLRMGSIDAGVHGRIDRVDRHPGGGVRVIDYKAGKAWRQMKLEKRIDEGLRLQLPIYALVVRRLWDLDPASVSASIRPLRVDASEADDYGFGLVERYNNLTRMLDTLAAAILEGRFPAVPYQDVCGYCVIKPWCRTRNDPREAAWASRHGAAVRYLEADEP